MVVSVPGVRDYLAINPVLNDEQRTQWLDCGYLVIPDVFTLAEIVSMRREADFILELVINSSLCNQRQSGRLDIRKRRIDGLVVRKIQPINDLSLRLAQFSMDDRLLDPMREFMQDEPILMEEKLNYKQPIENLEMFKVPVDDDRFPVHNDWAYYMVNDYPDDIVSSAIAIDDQSEENGTIRVFPGTHREHIDHDRVRNGLEVPAGSVDWGSQQPIDAPAGSVMFFHAKLIHTSRPNETSDPRRLMIYSHYPKRANKGIDLRNGPMRLRESPWEWEYRRNKEAGRFVDQFTLEQSYA